MLSTLRRNAVRAHYLWYTIVGVACTLLMAVVTVRYTLGGLSFESVLLAAFTLGLAFQNRRWFRRFRNVGAEDAGPRHYD